MNFILRPVIALKISNIALSAFLWLGAYFSGDHIWAVREFPHMLGEFSGELITLAFLFTVFKAFNESVRWARTWARTGARALRST